LFVWVLVQPVLLSLEFKEDLMILLVKDNKDLGGDEQYVSAEFWN